nr:restriction endonuclease subunit S [Halochromatium roseum]
MNLFGDPVTNPKGWHSKPFGELVRDAKIGLVRSASEFGESFEYPYVRMDAITSRGGFLRELVQSTSATAAEVSEYSLRNGDFLFNTRNSKELVGKCTVFNSDERDVLFNNNIMRVRFVDGVSPHFVSYFLNSKGGQRELDKLKSGTTSVFAVYAKDLNRLPIPLPNSNVQQQFEAMVRHVDGQIAKAFCSAARNAGDLADALSKRAFAGEL